MSSYYGGFATGGKGDMRNYEGDPSRWSKGDERSPGLGNPIKDLDIIIKDLIENDNMILLKLGIIWLIWEYCC